MDGKCKIIIVLFFLLLLSFCNDRGVELEEEGNGSIVLSSKEDFPCDTGTSLSKIKSDSLNFYCEYSDNNLELDFNFSSICGSVFADSLAIQENNIVISLADTSTQHAYCICPYQSLFNFSTGDWETVNLTFNLKSYTSDHYVTLLDTTLVLN